MAKRLRVIGEEEYQALAKQSVKKVEVDPVENARKHYLLEEDNKATNVLQSSSIPDDIKVQMYSSVLKSIKGHITKILSEPINVNLLEKNVEYVNGPSNTNELLKSPANSTTFDMDEQEAYTFSTPPDSPTYFQQDDATIIQRMGVDPGSKVLPKAITVLQLLKSNPQLIKWDKTGRITFFNNEFVPESNITDLINYTTRELQFADNPSGLNRFLTVCKMANVPVSLLSRKAKSGWMGGLGNIPPRPTATNSAQRLDAFRNWTPLQREDWTDYIANRQTPTAATAARQLIQTPNRQTPDFSRVNVGPRASKRKTAANNSSTTSAVSEFD